MWKEANIVHLLSFVHTCFCFVFLFFNRPPFGASIVFIMFYLSSRSFFFRGDYKIFYKIFSWVRSNVG